LEVLDEEASTLRRVQSLRRTVESHVVTFELGSSEITASQLAALTPVVAQISELIGLTESVFRVVRIEVEGYADPSGPAELNTRLSRERAEAVVGLLTQNGVDERLVQPVGRGTLAADSGDADSEEEVHAGLRRVTFSIAVSPEIVEDSGP
jgi:outer membrane protein OmpA-like peptidoglycan-associated protein